MLEQNTQMSSVKKNKKHQAEALNCRRKLENISVRNQVFFSSSSLFFVSATLPSDGSSPDVFISRFFRPFPLFPLPVFLDHVNIHKARQLMWAGCFFSGCREFLNAQRVSMYSSALQCGDNMLLLQQ